MWEVEGDGYVRLADSMLCLTLGSNHTQRELGHGLGGIYVLQVVIEGGIRFGQWLCKICKYFNVQI